MAWGQRGILAVQLPEANESQTRARLLRSLADARPVSAPPHIRRVIDDIVALLEGEQCDLRHAVLDMKGLSPFQQRVYQITRTIGPGQTLSYGEVAALCGDRGRGTRGRSGLGHNPFPIIVPSTVCSAPAARAAASRPWRRQDQAATAEP